MRAAPREHARVCALDRVNAGKRWFLMSIRKNVDTQVTAYGY
jgi:hypothetical protein